MKVFTPEELARENGQEETRTLVAVQGKVYDLSPSKRWAGGLHMKRHHAGTDLTVDIGSAPHGPEVLERFEVVGTYQPEAKATYEGLRGKVELLLQKHPFFRRHPHPAMVHFPLGLLLVVPLFEVIGIAADSARTAWAAYCCLIVGLLSLPPTLATGYFTWWVNYDATDSPILRKKRFFGWVTLVLAVGGLILRSFGGGSPVSTGNPYAIVGLLILMATAVTVSCAGFLGGKLTFPYHSE